ncbi:hypothetical protein B0H11DRAFT_31621 [Mycena galericulata]|nr:hypothetical protein B0H11DRAFT_31621 [Mycena galericulata]
MMDCRSNATPPADFYVYRWLEPPVIVFRLLSFFRNAHLLTMIPFRQATWTRVSPWTWTVLAEDGLNLGVISGDDALHGPTPSSGFVFCSLVFYSRFRSPFPLACLPSNVSLGKPVSLIRRTEKFTRALAINIASWRAEDREHRRGLGLGAAGTWSRMRYQAHGDSEAVSATREKQLQKPERCQLQLSLRGVFGLHFLLHLSTWSGSGEYGTKY